MRASDNRPGMTLRSHLGFPFGGRSQASSVTIIAETENIIMWTFVQWLLHIMLFVGAATSSSVQNRPPWTHRDSQLEVFQRAWTDVSYLS